VLRTLQGGEHGAQLAGDLVDVMALGHEAAAR
jgi:hypothetical protein